MRKFFALTVTLLLIASYLTAQDTLCNAAFTIDNNEPMHVQLDAAWIDNEATYTWTTEGGIIAEGISSNVLLYPGIREICLHVETPTCQADSCMWTDVLCTNNTIKLKLSSFGDSTGIFDTIKIQAFNGLEEVFTYSGLTLTTNQHLEWLECLDDSIDCIDLVISPQTLWQLYADSINLEAEYISGGEGPITLQILPNAATSPNFGELLGIGCISSGVKNHDNTPLLIWPNPAADVLNFTTAPDALKLIDFSGKVILEKSIKTDRISLPQLPSGIYLVQARYRNVWKTARLSVSNLSI